MFLRIILSNFLLSLITLLPNFFPFHQIRRNKRFKARILKSSGSKDRMINREKFYYSRDKISRFLLSKIDLYSGLIKMILNLVARKLRELINHFFSITQYNSFFFFYQRIFRSLKSDKKKRKKNERSGH